MSSFVAAPPGFLLSLKLALRELRGGLSGFRIFVACLALGVAAISGVGSISKGLQDGLEREGRTILGGDASFALVHREVTHEQLAFLSSRGTVSSAATLRAMTRSDSGAATLAELKAVDQLYPLAGTVETDPQLPLADLLAEKDGAFGAIADPALLARLEIQNGGTIRLGSIALTVRAALVKEPDNLSDGVGLGPRLLVSREALMASGLLQPGSLMRWTYRVALFPDAPQSAVTALADEAKAAFPDAGWRVRTRDAASDRLEQNIDRFTQFLTLVGLTALLVGGVGVANAVSSYVEKRRETIAALKCIGATGTRIFQIYLAQILALAALGIAIGLVVGAALPFFVKWGFGAIIPLPFIATLQPAQLALAALYGFLIALVFALWPLGRAHDLPVSALFRDHLADTKLRWPRRRYLVLIGLSLAALIALMIATAPEKNVAAIFLAAAAAIFLLLRGVALAIMAVSRRLPRPSNAGLRIALSNIHRPGALTPSVVLSLGLGLALLVALTLIDSSIRNQLTAALPAKAPSFFFVDIPNSDADAFDAFLNEKAPGSAIDRVPMLRGRITELKGQSSENYPAGDAAWVLRGDRGLTFASKVPDGATIVSGEWWPENYEGEPLVSFEAENAGHLGLKVGDEIAVNVLGREVRAKIANLRKVEWETLGINFVLVFSPNTFAGAPYQYLSTLTFADGGAPNEEISLLRDSAARFPAIIAIRVKDALTTLSDLAGNLALAVRAGSGVTLLASVLVLGGALAAGHRYRIYDAMILKVLGASRRRILAAFALEYALIGFATALFGLAAGAAAAWVVVAQVMDMAFFADVPGAVTAALLALGTTVVLGLAGTWRLVNLKPAPVLRDL
ncbi:ABC transporter permease [Terrihabitans soli]|uniref:ABC transporter permease n=1 Tax=Terrihabitans soli TaxID=708113 RepID=A0A6S6QNJ3_9HYPH|nr:FtsX-like permease family protein [Terrihabitans soli]BCJ89487.1 ABC transporter permease [Terrihabitans soli]